MVRRLPTCAESTCRSSAAPALQGRPPRVRGRQAIGRQNAAQAGKIPAHAGSTRAERRSRPREEEDPRARGVNYPRASALTAGTGGSPRTRGQQRHQLGAHRDDRRIPAHAGSTPPSATAPSPPGEDPRARGVNPGPPCPTSSGTGGSPRTRGQPRPTRSTVTRSRRIPAHAGSTITRTADFTTIEEDPRARGVNARSTRTTARVAGGSPRTRGQLSRPARRRPRQRRIPAHAGSTEAY